MPHALLFLLILLIALLCFLSNFLNHFCHMQENSFSSWLEGSIIYCMKQHQTWDSMWGTNLKSQRIHLPDLRQEQHYSNYYKLINDAGFKSQQLQQWNLSLAWYSLQYFNIRGCKLFSPFNNPDGRTGGWQTQSNLPGRSLLHPSLDFPSPKKTELKIFKMSS